MAGSQAELEVLERKHPLPSGWRFSERFFESADVPGLSIELAGLVAVGPLPNGERQSVTGSAADVGSCPTDRAYFELLERLYLLWAMAATDDCVLHDAEHRFVGVSTHRETFPSAGPEFRYAKSNGVALGPSYEFARLRARLELLERDAVLRSWYGQGVPQERPEYASAIVHSALHEVYDVALYELSGHEAVTAVSVAFPREEGAPLLIAFAAREEPMDAARAAYGEMIQRLGFLWGEEIPSCQPAFEASPDYHQEMYLWPGSAAALKSWLAGGHTRYAGLLPARAPATFRYIELSAGQASGLVAVKAVSNQCVPLAFGRGHPWLPELPDELRVHPIA